MVARALLAFALCAAATADVRRQFEDFKRQFGKFYTSDAEEATRFGLFKKTLERIEEGNRRNGEPVFGLTWMSDRFPEEKYKFGRKGKGDTRFMNTAVFDAAASGIKTLDPAAINWRTTEAVTPVKNQGQCGSCWAFSTAEEVESQYILHVSHMNGETFSPQQVNSCVQECDGCGGGDTVTAYQYLKTSQGLASSFFWPYAQGLTPDDGCSDKDCTQACSSHDLSKLKKYEFYIGPYATVTGFSYATPPCNDACANQDLASMASAVANAGPVSVCLNAQSWNDYTGGVLTSEGCGSMAADAVDHCVQLVGYNKTAPKPYWIVRNSWDAEFGEEGYIYLEFDKNTCGVANEATIVDVAGKGTAEANARFEGFREVALGGTREATIHV